MFDLATQTSKTFKTINSKKNTMNTYMRQISISIIDTSFIF